MLPTPTTTSALPEPPTRSSSTTPGAVAPGPLLSTCEPPKTRFTFSPIPVPGDVLFDDKGRPELGTGVLERVMREMNRRTDVGVRCSVPGCGPSSW